MTFQVIKPKDRTEWLKYRESGIGSSEIATIVGLNPYDTPLQLWRRKVGLSKPTEENFAMRAGHYLEDAVVQFWQDETKREVIKSSAGDWLIVDSEKQFLRVSPDRTYWLPDSIKNASNKGILECKTTQKSIDENDIPKHWVCQVQYQLGVAELQHASLAWLCSGREFGYKDMVFVPDFYDWLKDEAERFWVDNIKGMKEPAPLNISDILLKYDKHTDGKSIEASAEIYGAYCELKNVRLQIDELEKQKEALESKIKMVFTDSEIMTYSGQTIATWKSTKASSLFDSKLFKAEHPDLYTNYCKEKQGVRRFLIK